MVVMLARFRGRESERRRASRIAWIPIGVLILAGILRLYALGYESLWCDEAYTALTVRLPFREMFSHLFRIDDAPPLYYAIQKLVTACVGDSELSLRLVSAVAGISAVAVLLRAAWLRRSAADLWAAGFLAVATTGIFHSRQARSYSLVLLLGLGLVVSARAMLFDRRRVGPLLAVCGALLCLTHHVGVVLVLTSLVLWPLGNAGRPGLGSWILWHVPALAIWAGSWILASPQLGVHAELNMWIGHYWETHALSLAPLYSLALFLPVGLPSSELSVGFATPGTLSGFWTGVSLALGALCLLSIWRGASASRQVRPPARELLFELTFLLVPLFALVLASTVATPVYVLGRTDILAYPAFVLLVGRGLVALPRPGAACVLGFWGLMSLLSLAPSYGVGNLHLAKGVDRRLAERMIAADVSPDDWVVHTFMTSPTIEYYLGRAGVLPQTAWFPSVAGANTASDYPTPADSLSVYIDEARLLRRRIEESLPADGDVWVFGLIAPGTAEVIEGVRAARAATAGQIGYPVSVLVYSLVGSSPASVAFLYHQDWVAGERVVLRIPRSSWVPIEDLRPERLEVQG